MAREKQTMATFPRLRELREIQLGWEVLDIFNRLPGGKPSAATIYRLERGIAIRATATRRVFDVVNKALNNTLDPEKELKVE